MSNRIAVLVDGENIGPTHAQRLRRLAEQHGSPDVMRVYGNAALLPRWAEAPGYRLVHTVNGKNSCDLVLTIDAMELVLANGFQSLLIASSDGDFTPLALRLRERGVRVIGAGEAKAPPQFREACAEFVLLGTSPVSVASAPANTQKPVTPAAPTSISSAAPHDPAIPSELDQQIRQIIAANSKNGHGMRLVELAPIMHQQFGVRISTFPERTWRAYLTKRETLFQVGPKGPDTMVRFLPQGFTATA